MSRYTPKRLPAAQGGGPARPTKPARRGTRSAGKAGPKQRVKKTGKPGAFACKTCDKRFNTEEALATHAADAHGTPINPATMSPIAPNMVRCPICAAPVRKRNLEKHMEFIHESA